MLHFSDWISDWKKKEDNKTDSGLPMFVLEPPDLTPDDDPVSKPKTKSIPQQVADFIKSKSH